MYTYFLSLTPDTWSNTEDLLLPYISSERYIRLLRYVHAADRKLALYSELLTRMIILSHTSLTINNLQFYYKENHKPILLTDPSIDFSYSHTKGAILCCVSTDSTVGTDIEICEDAPYQIMNIAFHPTEIEYVTTPSEVQKAKRFYKIWTQKEAYTKRCGIGLACDLTKINTLESSIVSSLYCWEIGNYICSICGNFTSLPIVHYISEKDIFDFFHPYTPNIFT